MQYISIKAFRNTSSTAIKKKTHWYPYLTKWLNDAEETAEFIKNETRIAGRLNYSCSVVGLLTHYKILQRSCIEAQVASSMLCP